MIPGPLLVIIPHCDDEVLQAGGLLARANREGMATYVAPCRVEDGLRRVELKQAGEILGFDIDDSVTNWHYGLDTSGEFADTTMTLTGWLERMIDRHQPGTVVIPGENTHQEHRLVRTAALAALRPSGGSYRHRPKWVLSGESPTDSWAREPDGRFWVELDPSDQTRKYEAIRAHASQRRPIPSERGDDVLQALAVVRGAEAGVMAAERYRVERILM